MPLFCTIFDAAVNGTSITMGKKVIGVIFYKKLFSARIVIKIMHI